MTVAGALQASFVKFQVKLINFDGMSKGLAVILNF